MKKYGIRKFLFAILIGIFALQVSVYADVEKLNISQIIQQGNDVYLYVSALDNTGRPSGEALNADQLSVKIDEAKALSIQDAAVYQNLGLGNSYIFCIDVSKSVTEDEMKAIKDSMTDFVNNMNANDFARIITIGSDITSVCDSTQDKNALNNAIQGIERNADYTYLYKGLSFAMDGQRKRVNNIPGRAAIILFTDGMDDSDGAYTADQLMSDFATTRIPVYAVGLKGKDSSANLNAVGQIAQQSGGDVFSYNDMGIGEAVQTIGSIMQNSYQVHVQPTLDNFGKKNLNWSVIYAPGNYSVESKPYVYSLGMENVVLPTEAPTATPVPTVKPTTAPAPTATPIPEKTAIEKVTDFLHKYLIACVAAVIVVILLVVVILIMRKRRNNFEKEDLVDEESPVPDDRYDETLSELDRDETLPIDMYDYDSDETIYDDSPAGIKLEFEITFEGHTEKVTKKLTNELILGRGPECDVDVVLNSLSENRKHTSRKHVFIIDCPEGIYVRNNSRNKTYLNGVEVTSDMALCDGDVLQMGNAVVKIRIYC